MVAAYMATSGGNPAVLGFYTLSAMAVRSEAKWHSARVADIPVIYIKASRGPPGPSGDRASERRF